MNHPILRYIRREVNSLRGLRTKHFSLLCASARNIPIPCFLSHENTPQILGHAPLVEGTANNRAMDARHGCKPSDIFRS